MIRQSGKQLGVAQLGSALEWGSRGRKFKSSHPDHAGTQLKAVFFACRVRSRYFCVTLARACTAVVTQLLPHPSALPRRCECPFPRIYVRFRLLSLFRRPAPYKSSHPDHAGTQLKAVFFACSVRRRYFCVTLAPLARQSSRPLIHNVPRYRGGANARVHAYSPANACTPSSVA